MSEGAGEGKGKERERERIEGERKRTRERERKRMTSSERMRKRERGRERERERERDWWGVRPLFMLCPIKPLIKPHHLSPPSNPITALLHQRWKAQSKGWKRREKETAEKRTGVCCLTPYISQRQKHDTRSTPHPHTHSAAE